MVAMDTEGEVFYSLTQMNTDRHTKRVMLSELCKALDSDRPEWREDSIILMDNAPYNKTPEVTSFIKQMRIPMLFAGPYGYDGSPCELFFSYFKQTLIYESDVATGKL